MARRSKKAAAAQPEKSVADAAWSNVFPAQEGLSCLALLSVVQRLQGHYWGCEPVTTLDRHQFNRVDNENHLVLLERLMDDLAQLRERLPPLLEAVDVVFDDRTPTLAQKIWETKQLSKRGPPPKPLRSRFEFDLKDYEPRVMPYRAALKHLRGIVDEVAYLLHAAAKARELPDGWKGETRKIGRNGTEEELEQLPHSPIKNFQHLRTWLESWLEKVRHPFWKPAESYLDDVQRELWNARLALWELIDDPTEQPEFNDKPEEIRDAQKQLKLLIDWLGNKSVDGQAGRQTANTQTNPRRRRPKFVDPDEEDIRQKYKQVGTIKGTVEAMKLQSIGRITAHKRVDLIVTRDRQTKSRAAKRS
jgi:hypothetical protein